LYRFELKENEQILMKGLAVLYAGGESLSGALYLTNERLVFVGYIHGSAYADEKSVELKHISEVRGGKTFLIIPNELNIITDSDERLRFVINERDKWMAAINRSIG
jgi:hypothetical protein